MAGGSRRPRQVGDGAVVVEVMYEHRHSLPSTR